jgi:L-asparaginase II
MQLAPLIEATRGGMTECVHFGAVAVVNARGKLVASAKGHANVAHWPTFTRSTLKAFQALPLMESSGASNFGFAPSELAMLCASHGGEDMHVQQVDSMLCKIEQPVQALRCGCHVPLRFTYFNQSAPAGMAFDERHNNCSGKHTGFLAYCVQHGHNLKNYETMHHPLQIAIRRDVARACGIEESAMHAGIDGCSAPNYAMPLSALARGYARLATGLRDSEFGVSFEALGSAMVAHPELVSGTGRNDAAFMQAGRGDWITKIGADGTQVVASRSRGEALAVKLIDGNMQAVYATTVAALDQLGWLDAAQRKQLDVWRATPIVNARGLKVGARDAVFSLSAKS